MENSGKSNGKIWAKAMRKLGKRRHIFRAKIIAFARISIAFIRISHCFFPNSPLLLSKFPMAFARIFHGFCPNFSFSKLLGGHSAPPAPPPHTPMVLVENSWAPFHKELRLIASSIQSVYKLRLITTLYETGPRCLCRLLSIDKHTCR